MLVCTHYMDEAERCHGSPTSPTASCSPTAPPRGRRGSRACITWEVTGDGARGARRRAARAPGVEMVAAFGNALHVERHRRRALERGDRTASATGPALAWREAPSRARGRVHQPHAARAGQRAMNARSRWARFVAVLAKEFVQMRRDRLTFAMMVGVPIMQLVLFGFAINTDPKNLPTAVLDADPSVFSRSFVRAMENSRLLPGRRTWWRSEAEGGRAARDRPGPVRWSRSRRTSRASSSAASGRCCSSRPTRPTRRRPATRWPRSSTLNQTALDHDLRGRARASASPAPPPFELRVQRRYNPEGITAVQHRARA